MLWSLAGFVTNYFVLQLFNYGVFTFYDLEDFEG